MVVASSSEREKFGQEMEVRCVWALGGGEIAQKFDCSYRGPTDSDRTDGAENPWFSTDCELGAAVTLYSLFAIYM